MLYSYMFVPQGGHQGQKFAAGNIQADDVATARATAQTITAPEVVGKSGLEVILFDGGGAEIWRGPYAGPS
jgi:hypothetical protein